jgi:hypothetical protein
MSWMAEQQQEYCSKLVVYCRGALNVEVAATIGTTPFDVQDVDGFSQRVESRDYLIRVEGFAFDGVPIVPTRGDRIRETRRGIVFIHEVGIGDTGSNEYRMSDLHDNTWRIHTRRIGQEPV